MAASNDILKGLKRLLRKKPPYDCEAQSGVKLPATMRDLIEGNFDNADHHWHPDDCDERTFESFGFRLSRPSLELAFVVQGSSKPILVKDLEHQRPVGMKQLEDQRNTHHFVNAYWQWLKREGLSEAVDIDHQLCDIGCQYPIWKSFDRQLAERTGLGTREIFPQMEMEEQSGEPESYGWAKIPFYYEAEYCEAVPLLKFLQSVKKGGPLEVPEEAFEAAGDNKLERACDILVEMWPEGDFSKLSDLWQNALQAMFDSELNTFFYYDWWDDDSQVWFDGADSIDELFEKADQAARLRSGIDPLLNRYYDGSDTSQFWNGFVEMLCQSK